MNKKNLVIATVVIAIAAFGVAALLLKPAPNSNSSAVIAASSDSAEMGSALVRPDAPILGPVDAPVTLVEFFDPACETCRAFHPIIQDIRKQYPTFFVDGRPLMTFSEDALREMIRTQVEALGS